MVLKNGLGSMEETATMREKPQSPGTRGELMESARLCGTHRIYRTLLLRAVGQRKERGRGRERVEGEEGREEEKEARRERGKYGEEEGQISPPFSRARLFSVPEGICQPHQGDRE